MTRLILVFAIIYGYLNTCSNAQSEVELGMTRSEEAYDAICWYENLKEFPNTDSQGFVKNCFGKAKQVTKQIKSEEHALKNFGPWMIKIAMKGLPTVYSTACDLYLTDPTHTPPADQSAVFNERFDQSYPFQGFAYCLLTQLQQKFGNKAIEAVKQEKTLEYAKLPWITRMLNRENEVRHRYDAPPLTLVSELSALAQEHANELSKECKSTHSKSYSPGRQWKEAGTGESLAAGSGIEFSPEDSAYIAVNGWYEEHKLYPFLTGYNGGGKIFTQIGHFTQSVWKATTNVGYGYAINPDCKGLNWFIVARYSPAGNLDGDFIKNVLPPK